MALKVLSGDIGGTNTRLATYEIVDRGLQPIGEGNFNSQSYDSFDDIIKEYIASSTTLPDVACFGVAGPVANGIAHTTNLPWIINAQLIGQQYSLPQVYLLNDLEANAWGIEALTEKDFLTLQAGVEGAGNAAIISAGTGLGEAGLYHDGEGWNPFATEGGHTDFSPGNALEVALLRYLQTIYQHVSWERILSGHGLVHIHDFLREYHGKEMPSNVQEAMNQADPAEVISMMATSGEDEICEKTLKLFSHLYGVEAGNLALKMMAKGGVFIGGGIAPRNIDWLSDGRFIQAFNDKGRMQPLLEAMPVQVILNDKTALYGSAIYAARQCGVW
ncbi:MAG: glucokinase [Gammaproteobacteria bacterium]